MFLYMKLFKTILLMLKMFDICDNKNKKIQIIQRLQPLSIFFDRKNYITIQELRIMNIS